MFYAKKHFKKVISLLRFVNISFYNIFIKILFNIIIFIIKFILFSIIIIIFNF